MRGSTRLLGVVGWPVAHSLSPAMHAAAIEAAGLDLAYVPLPVPPGRMAEAVAGLSALGFLGVNVSLPHKEEAFRLATTRTPAATMAGAANTLRIDVEGSVTADNTDVAGITTVLREDAGAELAGATVLIIGAGGAARAGCVAAGIAGAARVQILNRTRPRAAALATEMAQAFLDCAFTVVEPGAAAIGEASLVLQLSAAGMEPRDAAPVDAAALHAEAVVLESVYARGETALLAAARARGLRTVDGLAMLAAQGAASFELWTGMKPDRGVMLAAARSAAATRQQGAG